MRQRDERESRTLSKEIESLRKREQKLLGQIKDLEKLNTETKTKFNNLLTQSEGQNVRLKLKITQLEAQVRDLEAKNKVVESKMTRDTEVVRPRVCSSFMAQSLMLA
mgnify:CR=1 FL=1